MIDSRLFRIVTGEEVVAELLSEDDTTVTIQNALVVFPTPQGVNFGPWVTVISKEKHEVVLEKKNIIYMVDVDSDVKKKYNQLFGSKLELPEDKKLIL